MKISESQMLAAIVPLDRERGGLPEQIYHALGEAARTGRLPAQAMLPSSRGLARALGVSRNTVNAAYELLRADGIIAVRQGARPRIGIAPEFEQAKTATGGAALRLSARGERLTARWRLATEHSGLLEPGAPDEALFPADEWARCLRRMARRRYGAAAIYAEIAGLPRLRAALARHLRRWRGVMAEPEQVIILPSTQAALTLAGHCLADPGDVALVESPGYWGARIAFSGAQLSIKPLAVDSDGADPGGMAGSGARLVYVTPSHQFPTGVRMPLARRMALLEHARASGAVILEDDYDSEFLWRGRTIAAMQGIDGGGQVIYLGTAAKSLLPGLRLAYMIVPEALVPAFTQVQRDMGLRVNIHTQAAFAEFIESGALLTHLRRIARVYEARGRLLVDALRARLGERVDVEMPMGGLQTVVWFRGNVDDAAVAAAMLAAGFNTPALSSYCLGHPRRGLVVGFSQATAAVAERFSQCLAEALA